MPALPVVTGEEVVRALERAGFRVARVTGSHHQMTRPGMACPVPVPVHRGQNLRPGTLRSIIRQAGLTANQLAELLRQ